MKHLLILTFGLFVLTSCGGDSTKTNEQKVEASTIQSDTEIPKDLIYTILEETPNEAISKCNLDIQLSRKINKKELTALANELRSTREQYNHLWIGYTLENMKVGSGAWATTHFTPDLEVQILGATADEEKEMNELSKNVEGGKILGQWFEQQATSSTYVYYEKNKKLYMKTIFKDKSSMESVVKKKKVKNGLRLDDTENTHGEYYIIADNGNLEFYNKEDKKFATGQTVK
jgi:hypothetical protein